MTVGQFEVPAGAGVQLAAAQIANSSQSSAQAAGTVPAYRQAKIVSLQGGTPPTVTVTFDGTTNVAGVQYMTGYFPAVNDIVVCVTLGGAVWILGGLAVTAAFSVPAASVTGTGTALSVTNAASMGSVSATGTGTALTVTNKGTMKQLDVTGAGTSLNVTNTVSAGSIGVTDATVDGSLTVGGHNVCIGHLNITAGQRTATTDGSGYINNTAHGHGGTPDGVVVSTYGNASGAPIPVACLPLNLTSSDFDCRFLDVNMAAITNTSLTISWIAFLSY